MLTESKNFLALIDLLYESVLKPELLDDFINNISSVIPCNEAHLYFFNLQTKEYTTTGFNTNPYYHRKVPDYLNANPLSKPSVLRLMTTGKVLLRPEVCSDYEFTENDFYQEILRPQNLYHLCNITIFNESKTSANLTLSREKHLPDFNKSDYQKAVCLTSHLQRALILDTKFKSLQTERDNFSQTLDYLPHGIIFVNQIGKVIYCNQAAEYLTNTCDGLIIDKARCLLASVPADTINLYHLIKSIFDNKQPLANGGFLRLSRPSGEVDLSVMITPFRPNSLINSSQQTVALIFVFDPSQNFPDVMSVLCKTYSLTPTEAKIAVLLLNGNTPAECCEMLSITDNTIRTHLKRIFQKLEVRSQSEMMRVLLLSPAIFNTT